MCRALVVLCVAPHREALDALRRATVTAEWELTPGATSVEEALVQLQDRGPHVMVTFGPFAELVSQARNAYPGLRIVSVGPMPEADAQVVSLNEVRGAILAAPRPGGPVRF